jgi:hypothetical protein
MLQEAHQNFLFTHRFFPRVSDLIRKLADLQSSLADIWKLTCGTTRGTLEWQHRRGGAV